MSKWDKVRRLILSRDEESCVRCKYPACDVHHRKLKGMGGTSDEEVAFGLANLISLCRECHTFVHAHPAYAYKTGYLVHSWDDPEVVKIIGNLGALKLGSDGTSELEACEECLLLCRNACRDSAHEF